MPFGHLVLGDHFIVWVSRDSAIGARQAPRSNLRGYTQNDLMNDETRHCKDVELNEGWITARLKLQNGPYVKIV